MSIYDESLRYHEKGRPGKVEVVPTKPLLSQRDLTLAYSPGVAEPCMRIAKNPEDAFKYTAKGNLVAVVSNGTAVLGLGKYTASKPACKGKPISLKGLQTSMSLTSNLMLNHLMKSSPPSKRWLRTLVSISKTSRRLTVELSSWKKC